MAAQGRTSGMIISALIIVLGIIHLGVGIGITARYRQYSDVFRQPVGLGAFTIVIGLTGIAFGALCLMSVLQERPALSKVGAICAAILGIFATASFIAALALNSQAVSFIQTRLAYHLYTYVDLPNSNNIMDLIQNHYQCCGESTWLDWGFTTLGTGAGESAGTAVNTNTGTAVNTNTGTAVNTNTGTTGVVAGTRRRRHLDSHLSPLAKSIRQRRQATTGTTIFGTTINSLKLPASCCIGGETTGANTIGGYCQFTAQNGTESFNIGGCLPPVADTAVSQMTGIAVINIIIGILAFLLIPILMTMFPAAYDPNNPNNKQSLQGQLNQEDQNQPGGYYTSNSSPNGYYNYNDPANMVPANMAPTYAAPTNMVPTYAAPTNMAPTYAAPTNMTPTYTTPGYLGYH